MITTQELALKLGFHPNTIRNYVKLGMPCIRTKRKLLFDYDQVVSWLKTFNN